MASRYLVGTADWTSTSAWAATTGGASGASVPTATDDVFIDANSNGKTLTVSTSVSCKSLTSSGSSTAVITVTSAGTLGCLGSFVVLSTMAFTGSSSSGTLSQTATSGSWNWNMGGLTFPGNVYFIAGAATWTLQANMGVGNLWDVSGGGTFMCNGFNVTCLNFAGAGVSGTTLNTTNSTITVTSGGAYAWDANPSGANLTIAGTGGTIVLSGAAAGFHGGGLTYQTVQFTGSGAAQIQDGGNTFKTLTVNGPSSFQLPHATTTTIAASGALNLLGADGGNTLYILTDSSGNPATISAPGTATVTATWCIIQDSIVTGGATFVATNSIGAALDFCNPTFNVPWGDLGQWVVYSYSSGTATLAAVAGAGVFSGLYGLKYAAQCKSGTATTYCGMSTALPFTPTIGNSYTVTVRAKGAVGGEQFQIFINDAASPTSSLFTLTTSYQTFSFTWTATSAGSQSCYLQVPVASGVTVDFGSVNCAGGWVITNPPIYVVQGASAHINNASSPFHITATLPRVPSAANTLIAVCAGLSTAGSVWTASPLSWTWDVNSGVSQDGQVSLGRAQSDGSTTAFTFIDTDGYTGQTFDQWVWLIEVAGLNNKLDHTTTGVGGSASSWSASLAANSTSCEFEIFAVGIYQAVSAGPTWTNSFGGNLSFAGFGTNATPTNMFASTKVVVTGDTPSTTVAWTASTHTWDGIGASYLSTAGPPIGSIVTSPSPRQVAAMIRAGLY